MNILILHSSSDLYGASKILLQTAAFLAGNQHRVIVVLSEEGQLAKALREQGVLVYIIKLGILRRKYFSLRGLLNRLAAIRQAKKTLGALIDNHHIEVVYSNTTGVLGGALVARAKKIPHVWHIHEIITTPVWFVKTLGWIVNRYSSKVIVVSEAVKKYWQQSVGEDKLQVVYNGLCYQEYQLAKGDTIRAELNVSENEILIGMIGRVHYWKGQNYFLHLARQLSDNIKNARFVMVGDAFPGYEYLYDELEKTKTALDIRDRVTDLGYRSDVPQILAALDVFVLPSILPDPLPTVILEAMAAGKPVVATAHGGAVEMVKEGETGILIPWDNAPKAAERMLPLLEKKALRVSMGQSGAARVHACFSEKVYTEKIEKILSSFSRKPRLSKPTMPV